MLKRIRTRLFGWLVPQGERVVGLHDGHLLLVERRRGVDRVAGACQVNPLDKEVDLQLSGEEIWVSALPSSAVLVRPIRIPLTKRGDCERALPFQAESRIPFPMEEMELSSLVVGRDENATDLLFYAARKSDIKQLIESRGIEPHRITAVGAALAAVVSRLVDPVARRAVVHCSEEVITCAVVEAGRLVATREMSWEGSIAHALLSLPSCEGELLVCGPRVHLLDKGSLSEELSVELIEVDLSELIPEGGQQWLLPLGLALVGLQPEREAVNFRSGPFRWRRYRRRLATFATLALLSAVSLHFLGRALLVRGEEELRESYRRIASLVSAEVEEVGALQGARLLEKRAGPGDLFPLEPSLPSVSEVVDWLSSHPQLVDGEEALIRLNSLRYALVQYPHIKRTDARYQLRLELEFEAESSTVARAFHAALVEPNSWVDPAGEVQWSATKKGYRTSFLLRDQTFYPNQVRRR